MKKTNKYSDENIERELNKIFNAGMKNHKLHPDDDSYDIVNKQNSTKKMFMIITKLRDTLEELKTQSGILLGGCAEEELKESFSELNDAYDKADELFKNDG